MRIALAWVASLALLHASGMVTGGLAPAVPGGLAPAVPGGLAPAVPGGLASRAALLACVWIVLAGLPRAAKPRDSAAAAKDQRTRIGALLWVVFALPPLALAARMDHGAGADWSAVGMTAVCVGAMIALSARAAESAAGSSVYALGWLVLVPGAPLLAHAVSVGGGRGWVGGAPWLAEFGPLAWTWRRAAGTQPGIGASLAAFSVLLALVALAESARRERGAS